MKTTGGVLLLLLALFMGWGFLQSDASGAAAWLAALIAVVLPAATGVALLAAPFRQRLGYGRRKARLEAETIEAEILRLAARHRGRLTLVEAVLELGVPEPRLQEILNDLHRRDRLEIEVTESGVLVYSFHDIRHLHEKADAKGILDV